MIEFSQAQDPTSWNVAERCWRYIDPPKNTEQCPNDATGGMRLKLFAGEAIQRRYGKKLMLALILDLPVCAECFSKMSALEVIKNLDGRLWSALSKMAQRQNRGIVPIKESSEIEHLAFDDPEYVLLRKQMAKRAASNESQPAPAGPLPEGVGNGN
jgi:hypothetical protein